MPSVFIGHGTPMNAITDNAWSRSFAALGRSLPRPRAVVVISAHFYEEGTFVTENERPRTIHDFGGFPQPLFDVQYPAPGDPELARRVVRELGAERASVTSAWGIDHGAWSVLVHVWPDAGVPVVELSIDARLAAPEHVAIGRALAPLRDDGVMILGSGNIVHNLRDAMPRMRSGDTSTPDWALRFDTDVARALEHRDDGELMRLAETDAGRLSHPTPDHWLPLLYVAGAAREDDALSFPITGFDLGSLSMRAVVLG